MKRYFLLVVILIAVLTTVAISTMKGINLQQLDDIGTVKITVNFYLPVEQEGIEDKIQLTSERPGTKIIESCRFVNPSTLEIFAVEEDLPKGFTVNLRIGPLKTKIPGIYKRVSYRYRARVSPFIAGLSPVVPSQGPIVMSFSAPVPRKDLLKNLKVDFDYELKASHIPMMEEGKFFRDDSQWEIFPKEKLLPGNQYDIKFDGIFKNSSQGISFHKIFKVAPMPKAVSSDPQPEQSDVKLYTPIIVDFDEDMQEVYISVQGMRGDIQLEGKRAVYKPYSVFLPGQEYHVEVTGKSIFGASLEPYNFKFTTVGMGDKYWVEINLRPLQKLVVYKGKKAIRTMVVSGGLPEPQNATPHGYFLLKDRGERFWTDSIAEGGLYWVRITGNWLIHSMPRNKDDEIIYEELIKHGIPASHGCIRLKDPEAKWFYDTIPTGTPCYIHD